MFHKLKHKLKKEIEVFDKSLDDFEKELDSEVTSTKKFSQKKRRPHSH